MNDIISSVNAEKNIYITKDHYKHVSFSDIGSKLKVGRGGGVDIRNRDFAKEERSDFVYNICGAECYHDSQLSSNMEIKIYTNHKIYVQKNKLDKPPTVNIYVKMSTCPQKGR